MQKRMAELMHASSFALSLKALLNTCGLHYVMLRCIKYSMTSLKCHNLLMLSAFCFNEDEWKAQNSYCWHKVGDYAIV